MFIKSEEDVVLHPQYRYLTHLLHSGVPTPIPLVQTCSSASPGSLVSSENASIAMRACCNGADFIIPEAGCSIYCKAVGQTPQQLEDCLNSWARIQGNFGGTLCSSDATATRGLNELSKIIMIAMGLLALTLASVSL
jgi:hypothetical protein